MVGFPVQAVQKCFCASLDDVGCRKFQVQDDQVTKCVFLFFDVQVANEPEVDKFLAKISLFNPFVTCSYKEINFDVDIFVVLKALL